MAELIIPGIYKMDIPLPENPLKNLNSYIICGHTRNLLIDTGFNIPACLEAIQAELCSLSIDMHKTDIFLTHMHDDHVGLAQTLATAASTIYISSIDAMFLESFKDPGTRENLITSNISEGFPADDIRRFINGKSIENMVKAEPTAYTFLSDGTTLSYGGFTFTCVLTPGHTPGHMCLYDKEHELMFLGDHVLFGITPNIVRWPNCNNSLEDYLASLQKISSCSIDIALPAHRGVNCTVAERVDFITNHHMRRIDEVYSIVCNSPGLSGYQIASEMHWDMRYDSWLDFPLAQKWFAVGEALAHIDYLLADGRLEAVNTINTRYYYPTETNSIT